MKVFNSKLRAIISLAVMLLACGALGFIGGYYQGTGVIPSLRGSESIAPPADLSTVTIIEAEQTLSVLRDKEYGDGYNCVDYAWDAMRLLRWQGQASVIIGLDIDDDPDPDHAILLVPTEDKGWVFVEPQTGKEIAVVFIGGRYVGQTIKAIEVMTIGWIPIDNYMEAMTGTEVNDG